MSHLGGAGSSLALGGDTRAGAAKSLAVEPTGATAGPAAEPTAGPTAGPTAVSAGPAGPGCCAGGKIGLAIDMGAAGVRELALKRSISPAGGELGSSFPPSSCCSPNVMPPGHTCGAIPLLCLHLE